MGGFSLWHILIFAVIVLLLFGGNRFSAMMGDVAKGLKSFKQGMSDDDQANNPQARPADPRQLPPQQPVQQQQQPAFTPGGAMVVCSKCNTRQPGGKFCAECGNALAQGKKFCSGCGQETGATAKFCANCGTQNEWMTSFAFM